jgi:sulfate transport system substrate-binding protein
VYLARLAEIQSAIGYFQSPRRTLPRRTVIAVLLALAALGSRGCGGASDSHGDSATAATSSGGTARSLSLVAYSTPQVVYDEIIPAFRKTEAGAGVSFKESFGASGEQSRAVEAGLPADVVSFSLEPDSPAWSTPAWSTKDWADTPSKGLVTKSVVASSSARATRSTSRPGTTSSSRASRS